MTLYFPNTLNRLMMHAMWLLIKKPVREDSELGYHYLPRDVRLLADM